MKRTVAFLSLFTSTGTLICCALPALFVALGMGASLVGLIGVFPQLVWVSENKEIVFGVGAVMLTLAGYFHWKSSAAACPIDPNLGAACSTTKDWSKPVYFVSLGLYLIGAFFAFFIQNF